MGQALANYGNFENKGFKLIGIFDVNPRVIGKKIKNIEIMHFDTFEKFAKNNHIDIAVISVPYEETPAVAEKAARLGVRGLWNFSPMDLKLPYDVIIENVHLSDGLMVLGYKLNQIV
ncbi:MAG: Redox-sensing transcriptional repressor Rex [Bacteroidetes bacterium ADurb.Bin408]|nr:MAG: Redox-sensing transcriptional repressor Rex [Bacteroidetes bacterium ADurb.Bin408]